MAIIQKKHGNHVESNNYTKTCNHVKLTNTFLPETFRTVSGQYLRNLSSSSISHPMKLYKKFVEFFSYGGLDEKELQLFNIHEILEENKY